MIIAQAFGWVFDPQNYTGFNAIPGRVWEHVWITLLAVLIAAVVAVPIGYAIGHTGRARGFSIALSGGIRALPTLGVLSLFGLFLGIGLQAPLLALVILAIPSVLAGAYSGIESVDPVTVDAAKAQGMTGWQVLTATLAAYVGAGGLGGYFFLGLKTQDYAEMLGASILVIALAIAFEIVFAALQRAAVPKGTVDPSARRRQGSRERSRNPIPEGNPS
ncbi:ABC transporter permease [Curtobacterium sp. Csp1]|nr:ABC transporter permease [Curtobacterium sp. Csp1]QKS21684.1 ABC transporter permease [Curtobacterium sp. Csp1]